MDTDYDIPLYELQHNIKNDYRKKFLKPRYDLLLEFINKFHNVEISKLTDFTNVDLDKINKKNFKDILESGYRDQLENLFKINIDIMDINIIKILNDCTNIIEYKMITKEYTCGNKKKYYMTITRLTPFVSKKPKVTSKEEFLKWLENI